VREQNKFKWFTSFECLLQVYAQLTVLIFVTFFFFFDLSIEDVKNIHLISDICAIIVIIGGFVIGFIGVKILAIFRSRKELFGLCIFIL
jgi:hypothetical protein